MFDGYNFNVIILSIFRLVNPLIYSNKEKQMEDDKEQKEKQTKIVKEQKRNLSKERVNYHRLKPGA